MPERFPPLPRSVAISPKAPSVKVTPEAAAPAVVLKVQRCLGVGAGTGGSGGPTLGSGPALKLAKTSSAEMARL